MLSALLPLPRISDIREARNQHANDLRGLSDDDQVTKCVRGVIFVPTYVFMYFILLDTVHDKYLSQLRGLPSDICLGRMIKKTALSPCMFGSASLQSVSRPLNCEKHQHWQATATCSLLMGPLTWKLLPGHVVLYRPLVAS